MKRLISAFVGLGLAAGLVLLTPSVLEAYGPPDFAVGPLVCEAGACTLTDRFLGPDGSAAAPSSSYALDPNTGRYRPAADSLGWSTGGTLRLTLNTTGLTSTLPINAPGGTMTGPLLLPDGSAAAPSLTFADDTNTGLFRVGTDTLGIVGGGGARMYFSSPLSAWVPLDMRVNHVYSSTGILEFGSDMASTHALGTGATGIAGALEVDGILWADAEVRAQTGLRLTGVYSLYWENSTIIKGGSNGDLSITDYAATGFDSLQLGPARTTDADPADVSILAPNAAPIATGTNQTGGSLTLAGGIGSRTVTIDDYTNCATDTVTVTVNGVANVCTENDTPSSVQWDAATSNDVSATNLAVCINAITGVAAAAVAAVVNITPAGDVDSVTLAEGDATCTTVASGADGQVLLPNGSAAAPALALASDPDNGMFWPGTVNTLGFATGGVLRLTLWATYSALASPLNMTSHHVYSSNGILELGGNMASTHTLGTGATGVAGALEVDGVAYFDAGVAVLIDQSITSSSADGVSLFLRSSPQTPDTGLIVTGSTANSVILAEYGDRLYDFAHAQADDPTLFIQSHSQSATEWMSLEFDGAGGGSGNGIIAVGAGSLTLTPEVNVAGVSGDGSGKAVCIKADGDLGTCTDAVGAGGTCTCN